MAKPIKGQSGAIDRLRTFAPDVEIRLDTRTGGVLRIRGALTGPQDGSPEMASLRFLSDNKELFDIQAPKDELHLKDVQVDASGNRHVRYQQKYRGVPVFGRELIVHMDGRNAVQGTSGRFEPGLDLSADPAIKPEAAEKAALTHAKDNKRWPGAAPLLLIITIEGEAHLAWHLTLLGTDRALDGSIIEAKWEYFVDAKGGKVLWRYNNLQTHGSTTGSGVGRYSGTGPVNCFHDHPGNRYMLQDQSLQSTARIFTHDANSAAAPGPVSEDADSSWSAGDQGAEVDSHRYTRSFFDYFLTEHGRNSFDGAGADMTICAHVGVNWPNASWNGSYVKIGDGDNVTYGPFSTLDIVAHEWMHAVTEHTANLVYYSESGALNESMSDVFAALIDGDWLQGEDNWLKVGAQGYGPAGRNLADPTNGGQYNTADPIGSVLKGHQPDQMSDKYTGTSDSQGVHINSGIMNKAAYLIANGGTHRNVKICTGLGRDRLGHLYYGALTTHLVSSSDFEDMRDAVLDSLSDLYSSHSLYQRWRSSIINAFAAVGIGTAVACPPLVCIHAPIQCKLSPIFCKTEPFTCKLAPMVCKTEPVVCKTQPLICRTEPIVCKINPILCRIEPALCKIEPIGCKIEPIGCKPAPMPQCPPSPGIGPGCLPGPDPGPFSPHLEPRTPKE